MVFPKYGTVGGTVYRNFDAEYGLRSKCEDGDDDEVTGMWNIAIHLYRFAGNWLELAQQQQTKQTTCKSTACL